MEVKLLEVAGISVVLGYVGIPMGHQHASRKDARQRLSKLARAGDDHGKLCRMIETWWEIRAPRFWWQEMDTYRVGAEGYSESTMHTIMSRPLTQDDFEEGIYPWILNRLNLAIEDGNFMEVKKTLPEAFLQMRLKKFSYQTLRRIYFARRKHRLPQWRIFLGEVEKLPFADELILVE